MEYSKREEVKGGWRKSNNEELHNFYTSPNIITVIIFRGVNGLCMQLSYEQI
jgi:hypothetical protein